MDYVLRDTARAWRSRARVHLFVVSDLSKRRQGLVLIVRYGDHYAGVNDPQVSRRTVDSTIVVRVVKPVASGQSNKTWGLTCNQSYYIWDIWATALPAQPSVRIFATAATAAFLPHCS